MSGEPPILMFGSSHCTALIKAAEEYYPDRKIIGGPLQKGPYWIGRHKYVGPFFEADGADIGFVDPLAAARFKAVMKAAGLPPDFKAFPGPILLVFGIESSNLLLNPTWTALWRQHSLLPGTDRQFISRDVFKEMLRSERRYPIQFASLLTGLGKRVSCVTNPPPRFTPKWMQPDEALVIHATCVEVMREIYAEVGTGVIDAGSAVTNAKGYMHPNLRRDPMHGNIEFGRRVLAACLEALSEGQAQPEAASA